MSDTGIATERRSQTGQQDTHPRLSYCIEYQPQLVEEAVLRGIVGHADERTFRAERDAIYHLQDEDREESFEVLHQRWFEQLGMHVPLTDVLSCWSILQTDTDRCLLLKALGRKETGVELFVSDDESGQSQGKMRSIVIQLTPEMLTQTEPLVDFLRRELLHLVDMLDSDYGYDPYLPKSPIGPTYDRLLQERYRILWNITIDGRLYQKEWLPSTVRDQQLLYFRNVFAGPQKEQEIAFSFFFDNWPHTHKELVAAALFPESWFTSSNPGAESKGQCPLCHFPSFTLLSVTASFPTDLVNQMQEQHPNWNPTLPVCQQCADLYELRSDRL
jgi:hypothetical protein